MAWGKIRLELASSESFPGGSAVRSYVLCLSLMPDGRIDSKTLLLFPVDSSVRRFWPSEPDMFGSVRAGGAHGWIFDYGGLAVPQKLDSPFVVGTLFTLTEPDGGQLSFRVASVTLLRQD